MKQIFLLLPLTLALAACGGSSNPSGGGGSTGITEGTLSETFAGTSKLVSSSSTAGLWRGNGVLDSGLDAATGMHHGGGHGVLGPLEYSSGSSTLDTDTQDIFSDLLGQTITVNGSSGGVFFVRSLSIPAGASVLATGSNPLQLIARGDATVDGTLQCSGEDAPVNFPLYRPDGEQLFYSSLGGADPSTAMKDLLGDLSEASGGEGGEGQLAAGAGGRGGASWFLHPSYFDANKNGWYDFHQFGSPAPDPTRFTSGISDEISRPVHGENGGRIGGATPAGNPLPAADADFIPDDLAAGSGMGSWAWPPKSNRIPLEAEVANGTWASTDAGHEIVAYHWDNFTIEHYSRGRSRGGGGGGYWLTGERGDFHEVGGVNALGDPLITPDLTPSYGGAAVPENWDFNGELTFVGDAAVDADREDWNSYLAWDDLGAGLVADAEGGAYEPTLGALETFYSLSPIDGFLRGGAGGGGAGMSQHGSFSVETSFGATGHVIESFRTSDGAGGGAGGGAVHLHSGNRLLMLGQIFASGGAGGDSAAIVASSFAVDTAAWEYSLPGDAGGGGGSGGAILIQAGGGMQASPGAFDVSGGRGGIGAVGNHGGAGGGGIFRLETPTAVQLSDMQGVVEPIESFDLGQRSEFGLTGANWQEFEGQFGSSTGDLFVPRTVGGGQVFFNGNSSGVSSGWYELDDDPGSAFLLGYSIHCEWTDGAGGGGTLVFDTDTRTYPGTTPVWIAIQTDSSATAGASPDAWIIPGYNTISAGAAELGATPMKRLRFQLVFDHDVLSSLIGNLSGATFRVSKIDFPWETE